MVNSVKSFRKIQRKKNRNGVIVQTFGETDFLKDFWIEMEG